MKQFNEPLKMTVGLQSTKVLKYLIPDLIQFYRKKYNVKTTNTVNKLTCTLEFFIAKINEKIPIVNII